MSSRKKSKTQIIRKIIELISEKPKSMYELSKQLGSNWDTVKSNVSLLNELGIVKIIEQKVVLKRDCSVSFYDDTIAGLPLSNEMRERIYATAKKISDAWIKVTGNSPNRTQLQKALVEIAEKFPKLEIPRGWYFYGRVVLVKVDQNNLTNDLDKYNFKKFVVDLNLFNNEILKTVKKISKFKTGDLIQEQYEYYKKEDYLVKRKIEKLLCNKFNNEKFESLLYELIFGFKVIKDDSLNHKVLSIVKEAISLMITNAKAYNVDKNNSINFMLIETFASFWKLYATYGLLLSLEGNLGYDASVIKSIFEDRINFYTNDLNDYLSSFSSISA